MKRWHERGLGLLISVLLLAAALAVGASPALGQSLGFVSDDFNSPQLADHWTIADPVGDGSVEVVGAGTGNATLNLTVPAGSNHNPWGTNTALRALQQVADVDFQLEAAFDSVPSAGHQMQGIMVERDATNWLRFELYSDGAQLIAFAAATANGTSQAMLSKVVNGEPSHMRVTRAGHTWTLSLSADGQGWSHVGSFTRAIQVNAVGPHAGNYSPQEAQAPANTVEVDYVVDTASPIPDPPPPPPEVTLDIQTSGEGTVSADPPGGTYAVGSEVQLTAIPAEGWHFAGWSGDLGGSANPAILIVDEDPQVTASFTELPPEPTPPVISDVQVERTHEQATISWTTDVPADSTVSYGPTSAYELGDVSDSALVTTHSIVLSGLEPATTYHYKVDSANADGAAETPDATFTTEDPPGQAPVVSGLDVQPTLDGATITFTTDVPATGEVAYGTDTSYALGVETTPEGITHEVTLTGLASATEHHFRVSATASGQTTVGDDQVFTTLAPAPTPPEIMDVTVAPTVTGAVVSFGTDRPATAEVEYGTDSTYGLGAESSPEGTQHEVTISGLSSETEHHLRVSATADGETAVGDDVTFTTLAPPPASGFASDDFNACALDGRWTFVNPAGDATATLTGSGTPDAHLEIAVPGGDAHNPWGAPNPAPRVVQGMDDVDFEVTAKFESPLQSRYVNQGLVVEQDANNWLRFDTYSDGSTVRSYTARTVDGTSSAVSSGPISASSPSWVRVIREGDTFTQQHSTDGQSFTTVAIFTQPMTVAAVGPMAGNYPPHGSAAAPAFTSLVDYVELGADPITSEDGGEVVGEGTIEVTVSGSGSVQQSPEGPTHACGAEVTLTATPDAGHEFTGWTGAASGTANPTTVTVTTGTMPVTAQFAPEPSPSAPQISDVGVTPGETTATVTFATDIAASGEVAYGTDASYGQTATSPVGTSHSVQLSGLEAATTYHFQVRASADGETSSTVDATFTTSSPGEAPVIDIPTGDRLEIGQNGRSQDAANVIGTVTDPDGIASATFRVNGGPPSPLPLGPGTRRLTHEAGYFNAEVLLTSLAPGENEVTIAATGTEGQSAERTVVVDYTPGVDLALPQTFDWAEAGEVGDIAQIVDGFWEVTPAGVRTSQVAYDRLISLGDVGWDDYTVTVPVTVHAIDSENGDPHPSNGPAVGLGLRWTGHSQTGSEWPREGFWPSGGFGYHRWTSGGSQEHNAILLQSLWTQTHPGDLEIGTTYVFKMQVTQDGENGTYRLKVWPEGQPEPSGWTAQRTGVVDNSQGAVVLLAHHVDATFGAVEVTTA